MQFIVVQCRAGYDYLVFVARILALELGEIHAADRARAQHLFGPVALGLRGFGRAAVDSHGVGGVKALHVSLYDGDADVVHGFLDRESIHLILDFLPLDFRTELATFEDRHSRRYAVGPRITVVVRDFGRRVVRVTLRGRCHQRRKEGGFRLFGILDARKLVVAALPYLDVVLVSVVQTLLQGPCFGRFLCGCIP
nr:hypothetical protein [uncultured Ruminococcus sp.]